MKLAFEPPPLVTVGIADSEQRFPVCRVFAIGRNYAAHTREMGGNPDREPPIFFTKWSETVVQTPTIPYPPQTDDYHYEAELVIALGRGGRDITPQDAKALIFGYAAGLDMTRRDRQSEARQQGGPWDAAKNVEGGSPVGLIHRVEQVGHIQHGAIQLRLNGELKQSGDLADMIWSGDEIIAHISRFYTLRPGDLIFTGTPAGVGAVRPGDRLEVEIAGISPLAVEIVSA